MVLPVVNLFFEAMLSSACACSCDIHVYSVPFTTCLCLWDAFICLVCCGICFPGFLLVPICLVSFSLLFLSTSEICLLLCIFCRKYKVGLFFKSNLRIFSLLVLTYLHILITNILDLFLLFNFMFSMSYFHLVSLLLFSTFSLDGTMFSHCFEKLYILFLFFWSLLLTHEDIFLPSFNFLNSSISICFLPKTHVLSMFH